MLQERSCIGIVSFAAVVIVAGAASAQLIDVTTYQGRLELERAPAVGQFGLMFSVWDAPVKGNMLTETVVRGINLIPENDGRFTINDIKFVPSVFDGSDRWIEITVWMESIAVNGVIDPGEFVETLGRQPVTATPMARFALTSGTTLDDAYTNGNVVANNGLAPVVVEGGLDIGSAALSGSFAFNNSAAGAGANILMQPFQADGAGLMFYDEASVLIGSFVPDPSGFGFLTYLGGDSSTFLWQDLLPGTPNAGQALTINGGGSITRFHPDLAGDGSVELANDAISPSEILAEAGVANARATSVTLGTAIAPIVSRSITVPADGYVLVLAQADLDIGYLGAVVRVTWGVSTSPTSLPADQDIQYKLPAGLAAPLGYSVSASAHGLFAVTAGTHTFYFNGNTTNTLPFDTMSDVNLTLLFVPTAYGTIQSNLIDPGNPNGSNIDGVAVAPLTALEIEAEYRAELARHDAEMEAKFVEQQRQLDEVRVQVRALLLEQELGKKVMMEH